MTVTLQDAIDAIQGGDLAAGKQLLAKLLQQDPNDEAAWIWMSGTIDDIDQRRYCLEKVLAINPDNPTARAGLSRLGFTLPEATPPTPLARMDHGLGQPDSEPQPAQPITPAFVYPQNDETIDESTIVEDTFIGDIVAAMNKDESASPPPTDTDLNWLLPAEEASASSARSSEQELREMFSAMDEAAQAEPAADPSPFDLPELAETAFIEPAAFEPATDQPVVSQPIAMPAFSGLEPEEVAALTAAATPTAGLLWRHPAPTSRQVTMLTDRYLISANPDPRHLAEVESMLQMGQFPRRLLGHRAKTIPLERITSLQANDNSPLLQVNFLRNNDTRKQNFTLASVAQRDEVIAAFKERTGEQFHSSFRQTSLWDTLIVPGLTLIVLALITGLLYFWSMDLLINPHTLGAWLPASFTAWLASNAAVNLPFYIVLAGGALIVLVMLWLLINLRKPRRTLLLERITT
jgi:hypothetical protein